MESMIWFWLVRNLTGCVQWLVRFEAVGGGASPSHWCCQLQYHLEHKHTHLVFYIYSYLYIYIQNDSVYINSAYMYLYTQHKHVYSVHIVYVYIYKLYIYIHSECIVFVLLYVQICRRHAFGRACVCVPVWQPLWTVLLMNNVFFNLQRWLTSPSCWTQHMMSLPLVRIMSLPLVCMSLPVIGVVGTVLDCYKTKLLQAPYLYIIQYYTIFKRLRLHLGHLADTFIQSDLK